MKDLPKELTAELLSLVLGKGIKEIRWYKPNKNSLQYDADEDMDYTELNIDTLTRLMKEFMLKHFDICGSYYSTSVGGWCVWVSDLGNKGIAETEFEAVLKATHWVAKEKGLI